MLLRCVTSTGWAVAPKYKILILIDKLQIEVFIVEHSEVGSRNIICGNVAVFIHRSFFAVPCSKAGTHKVRATSQSQVLLL